MAVQDRPKKQRDFAVGLSAAGAIFAGLVGTNLLDSGNSAHPMWIADQATIVLWLAALFCLAWCAYRGSDAGRYWRGAALVLTVIAGVVTIGVVMATPFNSTRDKDHGWLLLSPAGVEALDALCGPSVGSHPYGTIRTKTLQQEFVIFNFRTPPRPSPSDRPRTTVVNKGCTDGVDIPRPDVVGIREHP